MTAENTSNVATITPNFDNTVDAKDFTFRFKKDKLGNQRQPVVLKAGVPSIEGFVNILQAGGKGLELLQDAAYDVIRATLAAFVSDNENASQATLDLTKFTWDAIANQPREDRRANSITEEAWKAFAESYLAVMPSVTGKSAEQIGNAVTVFTKKFSIVKTNKPVLNALKTQLGLYIEHAKDAEEHQEILELLGRKVDAYLKADDVEQLVANL